MRSIDRRLRRLESRFVPDGDPLVIEVQFVSLDGSRVAGPRFTLPRAGGRPTGSAGLAGGGRPGLVDGQYREGLHP